MHSWWSMVASWLKRSCNTLRFQGTRDSYEHILERLKTADYMAESFQFFLVIDDKLTGGTAWQRIVSVLNVKADVETVMLYSSLLGPFAYALVRSSREQHQHWEH